MSESLFKYLPLRISRAVQSLPKEILSGLTEIRLRLLAPASVTALGKSYTFKEDGSVCEVQKGLKVSREELKECLSRLCVSSLYSFEESISQGFIPFENGGRAGVCGDAIIKDGEIKGFREIYSINLRVRRHIKNFGIRLAREIAGNGLCGALIFSPPNAGKTTLLRSVAHLLADGSLGKAYKVGIADERSEIYISEMRNSLIDAVCAIPKAKAIELLYRTLSPDIIVCDEISVSDTGTILQSLNTGVSLIASAHAESEEALLKRSFLKELIENGVFPLLARLYFDGGFHYEITRIEKL